MSIATYRYQARKQMKECCSRCESQRYLEVHHRDRNPYNNNSENLETLCKSCHAAEHERWRNFKHQRPNVTQLWLFKFQ